MPLFHKALNIINESDLTALVANQDSEAKTIEYKEKLPSFNIPPPGRSEVLKEFLADVSSFANASGGDLVYGVKAVNGVPTEVTGLNLANVDATVLQLEELIRSHIRPRFGFDIHPVALSDMSKGVVLIVRVRRGFMPPHQITLDKDFRFYSRNSAGKYRLDVDELRSLFDLTGTTAQGIRNFRAERLANIVAGQTPARLESGPKTILHLVPLGAFALSSQFDITRISEPERMRQLEPLSLSASTPNRWNLDGFLTWSQDIRKANTEGYVQLFHNGIIEAVDASIIPKPWEDTPGHGYIPADRWESALVDGTLRYLRVQDSLGADLSVVIMVSVVSVGNFVLTLAIRIGYGAHYTARDRSYATLSEVRIDAENEDVGQVMSHIRCLVETPLAGLVA
jgi:hypothetical protein